MGKVKNQMEQEERLKFYLELCYQEWLEEHRKKIKEEQLNKMAREFLQPYVLESFILYVGSVNNVEYGGG